MTSYVEDVANYIRLVIIGTQCAQERTIYLISERTLLEFFKSDAAGQTNTFVIPTRWSKVRVVKNAILLPYNYTQRSVGGLLLMFLLNH